MLREKTINLFCGHLQTHHRKISKFRCLKWKYCNTLPVCWPRYCILCYNNWEIYQPQSLRGLSLILNWILLNCASSLAFDSLVVCFHTLCCILLWICKGNIQCLKDLVRFQRPPIHSTYSINQALLNSRLKCVALRGNIDSDIYHLWKSHRIEKEYKGTK